MAIDDDRPLLDDGSIQELSSPAKTPRKSFIYATFAAIYATIAAIYATIAAMASFLFPASPAKPPRTPFIVFIYVTIAAMASILFGYENRCVPL